MLEIIFLVLFFIFFEFFESSYLPILSIKENLSKNIKRQSWLCYNYNYNFKFSETNI